MKFFACGVISGFQLSFESLKAFFLLLNMVTVLKQNEEIMKDSSVFSVIVLNTKDQHPWKTGGFKSGTCFRILGERK